MKIILEAVASEYGITIEQLKSKSRYYPLPDARKMACYFLNKYKTRRVTLNDIGKFLNIRHDGVLYNCKKHAEFYETEKEYREAAQRLQNYFDVVI